MLPISNPRISIKELRTMFQIRGPDVVRISGTKRDYIGGIGYLRKDGYREHAINRKLVLAHRIAFALANGRWPTGLLDHIDRNRCNNDPANLRQVSNAVNRHNSKVNHNSRSGIRGVTHNPVSGMYYARIKVDGKDIWLGRFDSAIKAAAAYTKAAGDIYE